MTEICSGQIVDLRNISPASEQMNIYIRGFIRYLSNKHAENSPFPIVYLLITNSPYIVQIGSYMTLVNNGHNTRVFEVAINGVRVALGKESVDKINEGSQGPINELEILIATTRVGEVPDIRTLIITGIMQVQEQLDSWRGQVQ